MMLERRGGPGQGGDIERLLEAVTMLCNAVDAAGRTIEHLLLVTKLLFIFAMAYLALDIITKVWP
jgi:hypothetical protein